MTTASNETLLPGKTAPDALRHPPRRFDTSILLAVAAPLIINSHLEEFYPSRWMAADGLLGASLFYMLSGFGVQSSLLARRQTFVGYYARRLWRIYPAVVLVVLATFLLAGPSLASRRPGDWFTDFIWPTQYSYVTAIVFLYAAMYFVGSGATLRRYAWLLCAAVVAYAASVGYEIFVVGVSQKLSMGSMSTFSLQAYQVVIFFIGGALALAAPKMRISGRTLIFLTAAVAIALPAYVAAKYAMVVKGIASNAFSVLHVLVIFICVASFFIASHERVVALMLRFPWLHWFVGFLSLLTLETYIVHQPMAHWSRLIDIRFPLNIAALVGLTLLLSIPLHFLTTGKLPFPKLQKK